MPGAERRCPRTELEFFPDAPVVPTIGNSGVKTLVGDEADDDSLTCQLPGRQIVKYAQLKIDSGLQIYFQDPRSPGQRGTNENTNGLLRRL